jgi:hypothetical protein
MTSLAVQKENAQLKRGLYKETASAALLQQETAELQRLVAHFSRDKPDFVDVGVQADPRVGHASAQAAVHMVDAAAGPTGCWRAPAWHARRRTQETGVTGIACAMVPEGVDAFSLDTHDIQLCLLKPTVRCSSHVLLP